MARNFGRVASTIWDDTDFVHLSPGAQRTYLMLVSQPDITACGSLALRLRRWTASLRPEYHAALTEWLDELVHARFIGIDEGAEELLVRTFIKWDGGHKNDLRVKAIHGASRALRGRFLRVMLAAEMRKLGLEPQFDVPDLPPEPVSAGEGPIEALSRPSVDPIDSASSGPLRALDTRNLQAPKDQPGAVSREPGDGNPEPGDQELFAAQAQRVQQSLDPHVLFSEFYEMYPRKLKRPDAERAYLKKLRTFSHDHMMAGLRRWLVHEFCPEGQFMPYPASWINGEQFNDEPTPHVGPRKATPLRNYAAERQAAAVAVVQELQQQPTDDPWAPTARRQIGFR